MTYISYKCISEDAQKEIVAKTLPEAKKFVEQYGGSFKIVYKVEKSQDEPHTKSRARARIYQKMH